jgi:hypothetical protein
MVLQARRVPREIPAVLEEPEATANRFQLPPRQLAMPLIRQQVRVEPEERVALAAQVNLREQMEALEGPAVRVARQHPQQLPTLLQMRQPQPILQEAMVVMGVPVGPPPAAELQVPEAAEELVARPPQALLRPAMAMEW